MNDLKTIINVNVSHTRSSGHRQCYQFSSPTTSSHRITGRAQASTANEERARSELARARLLRVSFSATHVRIMYACERDKLRLREEPQRQPGIINYGALRCARRRDFSASLFMIVLFITLLFLMAMLFWGTVLWEYESGCV